MKDLETLAWQADRWVREEAEKFHVMLAAMCGSEGARRFVLTSMKWDLGPLRPVPVHAWHVVSELVSPGMDISVVWEPGNIAVQAHAGGRRGPHRPNTGLVNSTVQIRIERVEYGTWEAWRTAAVGVLSNLMADKTQAAVGTAVWPWSLLEAEAARADFDALPELVRVFLLERCGLNQDFVTRLLSDAGWAPYAREELYDRLRTVTGRTVSSEIGPGVPLGTMKIRDRQHVYSLALDAAGDASRVCTLLAGGHPDDVVHTKENR